MSASLPLGLSVQFAPTFGAWREVARELLRGRVHPAAVSWDPLDNPQRGLDGGVDTLLALFAARRPGDASPLLTTDDGQVVTYGDVDERSGRLANLLVGRGVRPGDRVLTLPPKNDVSREQPWESIEPMFTALMSYLLLVSSSR